MRHKLKIGHAFVQSVIREGATCVVTIDIAGVGTVSVPIDSADAVRWPVTRKLTIFAVPHRE